MGNLIDKCCKSKDVGMDEDLTSELNEFKRSSLEGIDLQTYDQKEQKLKRMNEVISMIK